MSTDRIIFFGNRKFVITSRLTEMFESPLPGFFWGKTAFNDIPKLIDFFQSQSHIPNLLAGTDDTRSVFQQFAGQFNHIEAAGGVVFNHMGEVLLIKRFGRWDLPKGKVEPEEPLAVAAIREVCEETGIADIELGKAITQTHHTYTLNGKPMLKTTHWYIMHTRYDSVFTPQAEEGIELVKWVKRSDLYLYLADSYASLLMVLEALD